MARVEHDPEPPARRRRLASPPSSGGSVASVVAVVISFILVVAACSDGSSVDGPDAADSSSSTTAGTTTEPSNGSDPDVSTDQTEPEADDKGENDENAPYESVDQLPDEMLAVLTELEGTLAIGGDRSVAVSRPDGRAYIELEGDPSRLVGQPTWSRDGLQLVWSSASSVSQEARIQNFDDDGVVDGDPDRVAVPGRPIFYFQWSGDDSHVLYLRNSSRGPTVEAGVVDPTGRAAWMADGDPFFVSWSRRENLIAAHVGEDRVAIFDPSGSVPLDPDPEVDDDEPSPPAEGPVTGRPVAGGGGFSAPSWLDDDTLLVALDGWLSAVSVVDGDVDPLLELNGPVRFVVSPDRTKVALQITGELGADQPIEAAILLDPESRSGVRPVQTDSSLVVFDIESRQSVVVAESPAVAWEWSPDGTKLAWLGLDGPVAQRQGRWQFWSAAEPIVGNATAPLLVLSDKELVNYLPFFAQHTQSMTRWSPDSSAFALAGSANGRQGIWIHFIDRTDPAVLVAPGDFVTWGPGPTPPPTGGRSPA